MYKLIIFLLLLTGCNTVNNVHVVFFNSLDKKCTITDVSIPSPVLTPKNLFNEQNSRILQDEIIAKYIINLKNNLALSEAQIKRIRESLLNCEAITVIK